MRRQHLQTVRKEHPLSARLAELFDIMRGVKQETRSEDLMLTKTCYELIDGCTRSNMKVDYFCAGLLFVSYIVGYSMFQDLPGANQLKEHLGCRVLLSTLVMLISIVFQPYLAVAGAVFAGILPRYATVLCTPYCQLCHAMGTACPLEVQSCLAMFIGMGFLVASSNMYFLTFVIEKNLYLLFGILAAPEVACLVLNRMEQDHGRKRTD